MKRPKWCSVTSKILAMIVLSSFLPENLISKTSPFFSFRATAALRKYTYSTVTCHRRPGCQARSLAVAGAKPFLFINLFTANWLYYSLGVTWSYPNFTLWTSRIQIFSFTLAFRCLDPTATFWALYLRWFPDIFHLGCDCRTLCSGKFVSI